MVLAECAQSESGVVRKLDRLRSAKIAIWKKSPANTQEGAAFSQKLKSKSVQTKKFISVGSETRIASFHYQSSLGVIGRE